MQDRVPAVDDRVLGHTDHQPRLRGSYDGPFVSERIGDHSQFLLRLHLFSFGDEEAFSGFLGGPYHGADDEWSEDLELGGATALTFGIRQHVRALGGEVFGLVLGAHGGQALP